jgi:uncharacterized protein
MDIIPRRFFNELNSLKEVPGIIVLHGARQTGKSTSLAWWLKKEQESGQKTLSLDCEDPAILELCNSGTDVFLNWLKAQGLPEKKLSIGIDEIQYLDDPSRFLKLLYDHHGEAIRLAVSGSSSFEIKSKFRESLVGRTLPLELFGLDFSEYCRFRGLDWDFSAPWPPAMDKEAAPLFIDYAETGAYPGLATTLDRSIKARRVRQIISTYIQSDIRELGRIRYPDRFEALVKMLAAQDCSLLQTSELANSLKMARETVEEYLFLLEQTYVIRRLRPMHANKRSELTKTPKLYFEDNGVMNLNRFRAFQELDGVSLENAVYCELRKRVSIDRLSFWRTSDGREVDFILDGGEIAIEAKMRPSTKDASSLRRFRELYKAKRLILCGMIAPPRIPDGVEFIYPWRIASAIV